MRVSRNATLSIEDVSVEFDIQELSEIWWALQATQVRLERERPERPDLAESIKDIKDRVSSVTSALVGVNRRRSIDENTEGLQG